jgi:hypothetical protein
MYDHCGCALLWSVQSLPLLSITPLPTSPIYQQLSIHIFISSTFISYVMRYYWCSVILFSFPSFPESNRVVPLLWTCSTYEFVYDHACFCVYVRLWIYLPHMREIMWTLCFWAWLNFLAWYPPVASNYLQTTCDCCLWMSNTPLCI